MSEKISLPHFYIVSQWKKEKVIKWLKKVHLEDCIPAFEIRHIDGLKLLDLTEQKLFTFQDLKIKYRKQIAKCVQECKSQASNAKSRIAKNLKQNHGSRSQSSGSNGVCDSWDDSDDWGSDFEDSEDEIKDDNPLPEVNNNTITDSVPVLEKYVSDPVSLSRSLEGKSIPKPPDVPVISKTVNGTTGFRNNFSNSIPRPPLKRPIGQPPPPPVPQASSHEESQEDYEIPIVPSDVNGINTFSYVDRGSLQSPSSDSSVIETYEIVEPPDENYETVDLPTQNMTDKPMLPPRQLKSPVSSVPPPLPQKPQKLKEPSPVAERHERIRTFSRPKPTTKADSDTQLGGSPPQTSVGFIGSLMGRRGSAPTTSSPRLTPSNSRDGNDSSVLSSSSSWLSDSVSSTSSSPDRDCPSFEVKKTQPLPPLPPRSVLPVSDDMAQNMATRPLPPVPVPKVEDTSSYSKQQPDVHQCPWFQEMEREAAESAVRRINEPGAFVVRPSKRAGKDNPFSLTVWHEDRLFHLNIRQRTDNTFALGKEKEKEKTFPSVIDLITYHLNEPILLKNRGEAAGKTILRKYPDKT